MHIGGDIGRQILKRNVTFNYFGSLYVERWHGGTFTDIGNFIDNYLGPSGQATINFGSPRWIRMRSIRPTSGRMI